MVSASPHLGHVPNTLHSLPHCGHVCLVMRSLAVVATLWAASACIVNTEVPAGTVFTCREGQCPQGYACDTDKICRIPNSAAAVTGLRVTPMHASAGDVLSVWPVPSVEAPEPTSIRWLSGDTVLGTSSLLATADLAPGSPVSAEVTFADQTLTSCTLSLGTRSTGWAADRPARPDQLHVQLDATNHRLLLATTATLWEFDLEPARDRAGFTSDAKEALRWRQLTAAPVSDGPLVNTASGLLQLGASPARLAGERGCEAWESVTLVGTQPALQGASIAYDVTSDSLFVFGGFTEAGTSDALTRLQSQTWAAIPSSGPPARGDHSAIWADNALWILGGVACGATCDDRTALTDIWRYTPDAGWAQVTTTGTSPALIRAAAAYDAVHERILVWGGCADTACTAYGQTLRALSITGAWTTLNAEGTPPAAGRAALLPDSADSQTLVVTLPEYGSARVVSFAAAAWADLDPHPTPRESHVVGYSNGELVMFGGLTQQGDEAVPADARLWFADGVHWREVKASGPGNRTGAAFVATDDGVFYLLGGEDALQQRHKDLWRLTPSTSTWTAIAGASELDARKWHAAALLPDTRVMMFGGYSVDGTTLGDAATATVSAATATWTTASGELPSPRYHHTLNYHAASDRLLALGGYAFVDGLEDTWLAELWAASPDTNASWHEEAVADLPILSGHATVAIGSGFVVLGGYLRAGQIGRLCEHSSKWTWEDVDLAAGFCADLTLGAAYDADADTLWVFGADSETHHCDAVWRYWPASALGCD